MSKREKPSNILDRLFSSLKTGDPNNMFEIGREFEKILLETSKIDRERIINYYDIFMDSLEKAVEEHLLNDINMLMVPMNMITESLYRIYSVCMEKIRNKITCYHSIVSIMITMTYIMWNSTLRFILQQFLPNISREEEKNNG